jgi:hypothetical protein
VNWKWEVKVGSENKEVEREAEAKGEVELRKGSR